MGREDELQPSNINQTMQLTLPVDHAYDVLKNMLSCSAMFMMRRWDDEKLNICSFQGHCYCRRRPIALFDDYCGSRPPLLRIKATGC